MAQVTEEHYNFNNYIELHRWVSYWHQLSAVLNTKAKSVLEIGCGTGIVSNCMRNNLGLNVKTFDFDPSLKPDVTGDVRNISDYFESKSFDCICAFQVLEHVPYEDFENLLPQLAEIAGSHVLISLPYWGYPIQFKLNLLKTNWSWFFSRKITRPHNWTFDGEHYWEIGTSQYPLRKVRKSIEKSLIITKEYFCPDYAYHYFFECATRS